MTAGMWWAVGMVAAILAGDAALVGHYYWSLAHPPTRTRAASTGVLPHAPARVRPVPPVDAAAQGAAAPTGHQPPAGALRGDRAAPAGARGARA